MKNRLMIATLFSALTLASGVGHADSVKVAATPTGSPFTFLDTRSNSIEGVMVDIVKAVGKEAGFEVQIEPMQFSALIGSLTARRVELISAAMFITDERRKVVDFSTPVYSYGEGVVVPSEDTTAYTEMAQLKGKRVGVQVGTAFVAALQDSGLFSDVKLYDTTADLLRDANAGRIDVAVLDAPIAAYAIAQKHFPNLRLVTSYKPTLVNDIGIAARKDNPELLGRINRALEKLQADGTIAGIVSKWGL
ncbi:polar amino acid transport system substrate-binding protein [Pseudomonas flavescens]|uniref:Polar amino acid transport system substrate-binding protein n=1 Tax=Phytopseudomonas flavescens TaxID=29435 RepID=A0A1G8H5J4_9GAMM|nr:ABC transporter substrate-binding protein [Pseudomonas flavescens]SDI01937.1 polar amino acid transport system substrate-binding protein [Pseudomonas flavescens]